MPHRGTEGCSANGHSFVQCGTQLPQPVVRSQLLPLTCGFSGEWFGWFHLDYDGKARRNPGRR